MPAAQRGAPRTRRGPPPLGTWSPRSWRALSRSSSTPAPFSTGRRLWLGVRRTPNSRYARCTAYTLSSPDGPKSAGLSEGGVPVATKIDERSRTREPLSRERILRTAVAVADKGGAESLSMRRIAQELGFVAMALYKHVANKDELLDGMIDAVIGEIDPPIEGADWKTAMRERILSARRALLRHPWASQVIESRPEPTPTVIEYMDSMLGLFRTGGFSVDLTHHAAHAMGSRLLGFSQELFDDTAAAPSDSEVVQAMAKAYPYIGEIVKLITHDDASVVGGGCDDQFEFEFALDLMLDGLERLRQDA